MTPRAAGFHCGMIKAAATPWDDDLRALSRRRRHGALVKKFGLGALGLAGLTGAGLLAHHKLKKREEPRGPAA